METYKIIIESKKIKFVFFFLFTSSFSSKSDKPRPPFMEHLKRKIKILDKKRNTTKTSREISQISEEQ
jgi:hypothetical protein